MKEQYSLPHPSGSNKTVLLLYKLLFKVLPVTTFHVCNSAISFHFICVDYVVHIAFSCTELYLFLCFILVVFYIVFYIVYHCNYSSLMATRCQ